MGDSFAQRASERAGFSLRFPRIQRGIRQSRWVTAGFVVKQSIQIIRAFPSNDKPLKHELRIYLHGCRFQPWRTTLKLGSKLTHSALTCNRQLCWTQYLLSSSSSVVNIDSIVIIYTGHDISEIRVGCKSRTPFSQSCENHERVLFIALLSGFCLQSGQLFALVGLSQYRPAWITAR